MQSNRVEEFNRLSETAVHGRIIHKIDLIGMVHISGVHYFNVYRRYNNVYEIVIEDGNGDFYVQRDRTLRESIGKVLCFSESQQNSMYTVEMYSFRHGMEAPTHSSAPENMYWSEIQREWDGVEIHLRGVFEARHGIAFSSDEESDAEDYSDMPELISDDDAESDAESNTEDYSDMPELISDDDDETSTLAVSYKRTHLMFDSDSSSDEEEFDEESESEADEYIILRNGTKYRKIN